MFEVRDSARTLPDRCIECRQVRRRKATALKPHSDLVDGVSQRLMRGMGREGGGARGWQARSIASAVAVGLTNLAARDSPYRASQRQPELEIHPTSSFPVGLLSCYIHNPSPYRYKSPTASQTSESAICAENESRRKTAPGSQSVGSIIHFANNRLRQHVLTCHL